MMINNRKKSHRLTDKLQHAVQNLRTDFFGLERKVTSCGLDFLESKATQFQLDPEELSVRIVKSNGTLRLILYRREEAISQLATKELPVLFLGSMGVGLEQVTIQKTASYLDSLALEHDVPLGDLSVFISGWQEQLVVRVYNKSEFIQPLSVKTLVRVFGQ